MQEVQVNTEYQDITIKYYHIKNTTILKGVVVFFCSTLFDIYFQYSFNASISVFCILIKYISSIYLLKFFLFTKYKKTLFQNIRAPPYSLVSKKNQDWRKK